MRLYSKSVMVAHQEVEDNHHGNAHLVLARQCAVRAQLQKKIVMASVSESREESLARLDVS